MAGTTKLALYNAALTECSERKIASLTEAREPRYILDDVYDRVLAECLQAGQWNFATRSIEISSDPDLTTNFGFAYAFGKPTDFVQTTALSADENMATPLLDYRDETDYWLANADPLYVSYVSNDAEFGLDLTRWPPLFVRYVELALAYRICGRLTNGASLKEAIAKDLKAARGEAKNKDAMNEAPRFMPQGSWVSARGGGNARNDRGRRGSLTG